MKKLIALLMVCGFAFAFVACGGGAQEESSEGTEATETPAVEPADTTSMEADTTATDTTAQ